MRRLHASLTGMLRGFAVAALLLAMLSVTLPRPWSGVAGTVLLVLLCAAPLVWVVASGVRWARTGDRVFAALAALLVVVLAGGLVAGAL